MLRRNTFESSTGILYTELRVMVIYQFFTFLVIIFFVTQSHSAAPSINLPRLLVVSYDGFRYDFFDRNVPYLKELKTKGIYADYMINAFTTKTFPNHFTMATGLYVENHGVIDSSYYDTNSGKIVKFGYDLFHYNNSTMPIWTLNEKAGQERRSGVQMWLGAVFDYGGINITFSRIWNMDISFSDRIDEVISWFNHPETPINFGMLYFEEPDYHGHNIGISNDRYNQVLKKIDDTTRYLHTKLKDNALSDVNVIHVSDHGMASVTLDKVVELNKYVDRAEYIATGRGVLSNIFPRPGKEESIYAKLQKAAKESNAFDVYLKKDIPERYHYSNNPRIAPIIIVSKIGYAFRMDPDEFKWDENVLDIKTDDKPEFGRHGYDNLASDMHPIFFGVGPAFLPKCKIEPFYNVDLVPLFCDILEIPQPKVNGTLNSFKKCLTKYYK